MPVFVQVAEHMGILHFTGKQVKNAKQLYVLFLLF